MNPLKILAIKLRALGDTILTEAALTELKRAYPHAELHFLAPREWGSLFESYPGIHRLWQFERRPSRIARSRALASLANALRKERYDCVINFHASPSSSLLAFATGAATRSIHFHGHRHRDRFSTVKIPGKGVIKPIIERDMDNLRALGLHIPAGRLPNIPLLNSEIVAAEETLRQLGLNRRLLAIHLGASRETKKWPIERFVDLSLLWVRKENGSVLVFTGPGEETLQKEFLVELNHQLHSDMNSHPSATEARSQIVPLHALPLRRLAALTHISTLWVGSDSGPKHLAIAVGTPTVTLFGPEDPFEWHPYPTERNRYLYVPNLPCRRDADPGMPPWCGISRCIIEENRCMRLIGVDAVFEECRKLSQRA